jgi:iron complex outermembrane receptor protein
MGILLLPVGVIFASDDTPGTITGYIKTGDNQPAAFVQVKLQPTGRQTLSDEAGYFIFDKVQQGTYTLEVSGVNVDSHTQSITLAAGKTETLNIALTISARELYSVVVSGQKRRTATATKMNVPLRDIPMSIQVIDQKIIQQQAIIDIKDVVRNVSGMNQTGSYNGGYQYFNSRGFDMNNWTNFRRNGTLLWNMGNHFADFYESIEFLKGPAAILYGDVAPGGIMNFVTKKPLNYDYRRFDLRFGSHGLFRPSMDISGKMNEEGNLLYRLNVAYEKGNSFRDVVENETIMLAPSVTWNISNKTSWNVEANYKSENRVGDPGLVSPDGTFEGLTTLPVNTFLGEREATYTYKNASFFSTLRHQLSRNWHLQNTLAYTQTVRTPLNVYLNNDADEDGNITRYQYFFKQKFDTYTGMLDLIGQLQTGGIKHKIVVGADAVADRIRGGGFLEQDIEGTINLFNPVLGKAGLKALPQAWDNTASFTNRLGLYAQDQMSFAHDKLNLLVGLRYNVYTSGTAFDNPADKPDDYSELRENPLVPRLGIVYKPARNVSVYGSYAESYEVNGPDWIDPSIMIGPTSGKQFEVGVKTDLLNQRLGVTLAAFNISKRDVYNWGYSDQAPTDHDFIAWTPDYGGYFTYLAGEHRSRGIELDINGRVNDQLNILVSASYIQAEVVDDIVYKKGNWLANQPRTMFSAWANYDFSKHVKGLSVGYGFFYKGKFYADPANDPNGLVPENYTMDVSMAYQWKKIRFQANVSNLTNRINYLGAFGTWEPQWTRRLIAGISYTF